MKNILIAISFVAALALAWSCNNNEDEVVATEQNFTVANGTYYGNATLMQADSLILNFEAGTFNSDGKPSGEAKRLTVTCYVPAMFDDEIYLGDGTYSAATTNGELPMFIHGALVEDEEGNIDITGTYLEVWSGAGASTNSRTVMLFTGGSIEVSYSITTEKYTITASLTDAEDNIFNATFVGKLELTIPTVTPDETPDNLIAMYYGDGNSSQPQRWILDVFGYNTGNGGYSGLLLDICASRVFLTGENANTLQEGEYRIGADGATGTYLPGSYDDGTLSGSYYYVADKDQNITGGYYITGGTFTIERTTAGTYILTAALKGRNIEDGAEESKVIEYRGNPLYMDMSGTPPEEE